MYYYFLFGICYQSSSGCYLFAECTAAGALKLISKRTLPFWWDDASNFTVLVERLVFKLFSIM